MRVPVASSGLAAKARALPVPVQELEEHELEGLEQPGFGWCQGPAHSGPREEGRNVSG